MIEIKNLRVGKPQNEWDVRVDRASVLGNPFFMKNESDRDEVCDKYENYFNTRIKKDINFRNEVDKLYNTYIKYGKLNLYCWCAPKRCHAETIKRYIEKMLQELKEESI